VFVVAGLVSAWCSTAFAGAPAWCKGQDFKESASNFGRITQTQDYVDKVRVIVEMSCPSEQDMDETRPEIEKVRAQVSKDLFMNDADWADAVEYVAGKGFSSTDIPITEKTLGGLTPIDQYAAIKQGFRNDSGYDGADDIYIADSLEGVLTETGRLGFLEKCAGDGGVGRDDYGVVRWAICADDVAKFDGTKFANELRLDTAHPAMYRTMLHIRAGEVMAGLKDVAAKKQKLIKRDDAYQKVFDTAAKGMADWRKGIGTQKDLLQLVTDMDSATFFHSRKQLAGCEDRTGKALADAASKFPAKTFTGMHDIRDDPFAGFAHKAGPVLVNNPQFNLAATAFALCQPKTATSGYLAAFLQEVPGVRGPRSAAFSAVFGQKFELDDTHAKDVPVPQIGPRPYNASGGSPSSAGGAVESVKPGTGDKKGVMIVTLQATKITQEDCVKEHRTNRIVAITSGGELQYEIICDKTAMVTHDNTWAPFKITPGTAKWLKPGVVFSAIGANDDQEVMAVWPSKTAKLPSLLFGGALK